MPNGLHLNCRSVQRSLLDLVCRRSSYGLSDILSVSSSEENNSEFGHKRKTIHQLTVIIIARSRNHIEANPPTIVDGPVMPAPTRPATSDPASSHPRTNAFAMLFRKQGTTSTNGRYQMSQTNISSRSLIETVVNGRLPRKAITAPYDDATNSRFIRVPTLLCS